VASAPTLGDRFPRRLENKLASVLGRYDILAWIPVSERSCVIATAVQLVPNPSPEIRPEPEPGRTRVWTSRDTLAPDWLPSV